MSKKYLYKYLREGLKSNSGDCTWKLGEWKKEKDIDICKKGFHASKTPLQALGYVGGEILAKVEVKGKSIINDDKECWSEMKIIKAWNWTKQDSITLSIYAAELCINNYEKVYPEDKRPRNAIEAAKKVLLNDTEENRSAARSAARSAESAARSAESAWSAARSAESAWSAESEARSAARSAESAARSAESAWSAARSAESAARSAESAWSAESEARSAAWSAESAESAKKKLILSLDKWFVQRIKVLTEYDKNSK